MLKLVIHNRTNQKRAATLEQQMASQGITDYEIIDAVMHPKSPPWGIAKSFKNAVTTARQREAPMFICMEDDVMFPRPDSFRDYLDYMQYLPDDWELYLGGIYAGTPEPINEHLARVEGRFSGLHLVCIHERAYDKFLNYEGFKNIDWALSAEIGVKAYVAYPFLAIQHDGYSDNVRQRTNYNKTLFEKYKIKTNNNE